MPSAPHRAAVTHLTGGTQRSSTRIRRRPGVGRASGLAAGRDHSWPSAGGARQRPGHRSLPSAPVVSRACRRAVAVGEGRQVASARSVAADAPWYERDPSDAEVAGARSRNTEPCQAGCIQRDHASNGPGRPPAPVGTAVSVIGHPGHGPAVVVQHAHVPALAARRRRGAHNHTGGTARSRAGAGGLIIRCCDGCPGRRIGRRVVLGLE